MRPNGLNKIFTQSSHIRLFTSILLIMEVKVISNVNCVGIGSTFRVELGYKKKYGTIHELFRKSKYHRYRCGLLERDVTKYIWGILGCYGNESIKRL